MSAAVTRPPAWAKGAGALSLVTVVVSAGNYAYSLAGVRLLDTDEFASFAAAQGLLLVLGSGCMAAVPWAVARYVSLADRPQARAEAMHFGLAASLAQGAVLAPIAGLVLWSLAGPGVGLVAAAGTLSLSLVAAPIGFLQGEGRVVAIARLRLLEWAVRVATGLGALLLWDRSASLALLGYPVGSALLFGVAMVACSRAFPLRRGNSATVRLLVTRSAQLGAVQVLLSMLAALDTVAAEAAGLAVGTAGSYQAAALLGRIPLFLSTAVALAAYTHIVTAEDDTAVGGQLRHALFLFGCVAAPATVACWTVPADVLGLLLPAAYDQTAELLRFTSLSGLAIGFVNVIITAHQARRRFRPAIAILAPAALVQPVALISAGRLGGVDALVVVLVVIALLTAALIALDARAWLRVGAPSAAVGAGAAVGVVVVVVASANPVAWVLAMTIVLAIALATARRQMSGLTGPGGV